MDIGKWIPSALIIVIEHQLRELGEGRSNVSYSAGLENSYFFRPSVPRSGLVLLTHYSHHVFSYSKLWKSPEFANRVC